MVTEREGRRKKMFKDEKIFTTEQFFITKQNIKNMHIIHTSTYLKNPVGQH